jgi:hypothetical protein
VKTTQSVGKTKQTRRVFLRTASYVAPAVITLKAAPAVASLGSGRDHDKFDWDWDRGWIEKWLAWIGRRW